MRLQSRFDAVLDARRPIGALYYAASERAARPDQIERREQPPGFVAVVNGAGEQHAGHRGGVEAVCAEAAGEPQPGRYLAQLRHAVQRRSDGAGPGIVEADVTDLRKRRGDRLTEPA